MQLIKRLTMAAMMDSLFLRKYFAPVCWPGRRRPNTLPVTFSGGCAALRPRLLSFAPSELNSHLSSLPYAPLFFGEESCNDGYLQLSSQKNSLNKKRPLRQSAFSGLFTYDLRLN
jgi:hypothetical protein